MADSAQLIAATGDPDLKSRMTALLASTGASNAAGLIEVHMGALVAVPIDGNQCVADVLAYASTARRDALTARAQAIAAAETANPIPPAPGANLAAVTDTHLVAAMTTVGILPS